MKTKLRTFARKQILGKPIKKLVKKWLKYSIPMTRASDISRKKTAKFRGIFRGKFAKKSADFAGKKSKFAEQLADFGRFSWEKSQNAQKNWPISRDFSGKKSILEGFSGANS